MHPFIQAKSVRQQKGFTKSIAEDWPETMAQIRGVFKSCIKVVRRATKRQNAFSMSIIGSLNFGGDLSLLPVHVIMGITLLITT
jgi:hypothetical protein